VQVFNSVAPVTQNIGEASIDGFEVELFASPAEGWFIEGSLSLLNAEYDSIDTANTLILQSNEFERVPETTASVGLSKELNLADVGTLLLRADWSYRSETYNDAYNTPLLETDSYSLIDASVRWTNTGGDWTVILAGTNLSDEQYLVTGVYGTAFQSLEGVYNRGRQWRVEVRKAF
jgi:iron complex outermembrane receptor protein